MKHSKKITAALERRRKAFTPNGPSQNNNQVCVMPGSQNRKKGCGMSRSSR